MARGTICSPRSFFPLPYATTIQDYERESIAYKTKQYLVLLYYTQNLVFCPFSALKQGIVRCNTVASHGNTIQTNPLEYNLIKIFKMNYSLLFMNTMKYSGIVNGHNEIQSVS